jgi:molybdate transport system substrate-binding protein
MKSIVKRSLQVALISGALASVAPSLAGAAEIRFLCAAAIESWMIEVIPQFEKSSGHTVNPTFLIINDIAERVRNGESADLAVVSPALWQTLQAERRLDPNVRIAIAKVGYGVFVKKGAARPDISSVEALKHTLLNARSIGFALADSTGAPRGPTGAYQVRLFDQLGISGEIKQKIVRPGFARPGQVVSAPMFELVASGEAEIGVAMISEILQAPGVDFVGLVPAEVADYIVFTTGIPTIAREPAVAKVLISFLTLPSSASVLKSKGLEQP